MVSILAPSITPGFSSRLQILRWRERAWKTLAWSGRYKLNLPPTGSVYEFVGGLYGNGREDDRRITASISFLELPSADTVRLESGAPDLKTWTHPMFDITIVDFTMDPAQDLLVLIALAPRGYVHSRSIYSMISLLFDLGLAIHMNSTCALCQPTSCILRPPSRFCPA